jgi:hypothetical protein
MMYQEWHSFIEKLVFSLNYFSTAQQGRQAIFESMFKQRLTTFLDEILAHKQHTNYGMKLKQNNLED